MADPVVADAVVPRKPVAPADTEVQSLPLTLVVSDREAVSELIQKSDGRERNEYALAALRIGVLSLKYARGQVDADAVRREGDNLLKELKSVLDGSRNEIHTNLTNALKEYFDPSSGRFQERIERLIKQDGEIEQVLQRQVGGSGSVLAGTLAEHIGENSPLMKLLNPEEATPIFVSDSAIPQGSPTTHVAADFEITDSHRDPVKVDRTPPVSQRCTWMVGRRTRWVIENYLYFCIDARPFYVPCI